MIDFFRCFDKTISVTYPQTVIGEIEDTRFWISRFCPCAECVNHVDTPTLSIVCLEDTACYYTISSSQIRLYGFWNSFSSWLGKFVSQCFQSLVIESSIVFLPAASLFFGDASVLILGDFWQGKTTLSLSLMSLGFNLISDNYTAVKNTVVLGGTRFLSVRSSMSHCVPDEYERLKDDNGRFFYERPLVDIRSKTVSLLVSPNLCAKKLEMSVLDRQEALWYLFGKATRLINGEPLLFNGKLASPSFNDSRRADMVLTACHKLLEGTSAYVVSGKPEEMALCIKAMLKGLGK